MPRGSIDEAKRQPVNLAPAQVAPAFTASQTDYTPSSCLVNLTLSFYVESLSCIISIFKSMNWTEGARARAPKNRRRDEELSRQQEFFAKARMRHAAEAKSTEVARRHQSQAAVIFDIEDRRNTAETLTQERDRTRRHSAQKRPRNGSTASPSRRITPAINSPAQQERALSPRNANEVNVPTGAADIKAKKQRLLRKDDWTGISLQKSLTIDYPQPTKMQHGSLQRNPRKAVNFEAARVTSTKSKAGDIRVCVGSQNFR
ncbi:hypothetical protein H634G_08259 [Metarhizium anisopliae BRIP 53293]|uniref:Uncharacterized protein n=1 Tax=Metarhizium anisopliae BRIP 53293 TaxID=1291518 RepID=A0A0D9NRF4_METAN|nr:hypothetical protein H634G_08259 [Metarhizium anisopliae BRIP 53293]KJK94162.1 hypothetical protein H633G_01955 [Metarhizium anisopliae BRIP 53284]